MEKVKEKDPAVGIRSDICACALHLVDFCAIVFAQDVFLCRFDSPGIVTAIVIRANCREKFLIQRGTPDHNNLVFANSAFNHRVDDNLHIRHCGRQRGGHANDVCTLVSTS